MENFIGKYRMKKIAMFLLTLSLFMLISGINSLFAQDRFEGTVEIKLSGKKSDNDVKYYAKGNMARVEMGENAEKQTSLPLQGTVIFKNDRMFILMPERKTYLEKPLNISEKLNELSRRENLDGKVTRTGEQKDIQDHKAEQWLIKTRSGEIELWSTKELGNFLFFQDTKGNYPKWFENMTSGGFFPLLVIQKDINGDEVNRLEVTDIKKESVDDNYFQIPAGYKKTEGRQQNRSGSK